jgi:peptidoglycan/xylan/chitin deacetylase (PgdA/CDA1 family)
MSSLRRAMGPFARIATRGLARIFMFHRFGPPGTPDPRRLGADLLDDQLGYLRRNFRVVPLRELVARLRAGRSLAPGVVALTVDDAYSDFGEHAYPVFERHQVPVTLYVVSDFAAGRTWPWWDIIRHMLNCALDGEHTGTVLGETLRLSLADRGSREEAWRALGLQGTTLSPRERERYVEELRQVMSVALPGSAPPEYALMTWDQLRKLDPALVEVGAHTRSHAILSRCDAEELRVEVEVPKLVIERELGRPVTSFCYPNGQPSDVTAATRAAVREAGYDNAVMACGTLVSPGADLFALSRMGVSADWGDFVAAASGLSHLRGRLWFPGAW